jgi:tRNA A-37 threonylcarbamoyl transferase component Bud32
MNGSLLDNDMRSEILKICREETEKEIFAAAASYSYTCGRDEVERRIDIMLILESKAPTLFYDRKSLNGRLLSILAVDRVTFERDVEKDWLGGMLVENLLMPYDPLLNGEFLWSQEVKAKKRLVIEIIDNLILEYPEMSREMLINPEFFMWEAIARKASLYPPIICRLLSTPEGGISLEAQRAIMRGFEEALREAEKDGKISFLGEFVKIRDEYVDAVKGKRPRLLILLKNVRNSILRHTIEVFPKMMFSLFEDYAAYVRKAAAEGRLLPELEDTKRFIYIPTSSGLVSLSDKLTLSEFARKMLSGKEGPDLEVERLGGVLNSVYLVSLPYKGRTERGVIKVFKSWYGLKWLPLALWALGTRGFAVMGKTRLEREYAINRFLSSRGVRVPRIIHVSPTERLIFQEYVEGESIARIIKRICSSGGEDEELYSVIRKVGEEIAKVHGLGVSLGDCKPENMKLTEDGRICFLDLEQAERGGDQAWDVAEFLYYSGHYAYMSPIRVPRKMTEGFVDGYLEGGGDAERIREARSPKYLKVFSFFTPPHILYVIANTCGKKLEEWRTEKE